MSGGRRWRVPTGVALAVSLVAAGLLLAYPPGSDEPAPASRTSLAQAWPGAARAEIPGNLPDGPVYQPLIFLDARTSAGTAPSPDGTGLRLVLRGADGTPRELRRRPLESHPEFATMAVSGTDLVWTESAGDGPTEVWAATTSGTEVRRLTRDTGNAVFFGSQWDVVIADGRAWWAAAADDPEVTEIRSVPLAGGAVTVRREPGTWALTTWPWLTDGSGDQTGTTRLRSLASPEEVRVASSGTELATCGPAWCRVLVLTSEGLARIDAMRPDGTGRRRIADGTAGAAVPDVAVLDRFEILSEADPNSALTGTEGLLVHDLRDGRTVDVSAAAEAAYARNGVLWWSTGDQDSLVWHTLDLRTV
ncbi:hypothetical protein [Couchioplanes caeruleus]|uniref:WD40 repeat protein n=2 Tax=Couchioplanes caeruleus TaxID=56438 RepID=A0A1K0FIF7_9ACTN|nr:hypothetical protein [Couchioplanes caeruleus]OJF12609.1 hypothetical protein BG844_19705 [Couchioplanes caeruleus subsp. caeruleus]ROP27625.1 hypothetical protein EDD30_0311 [Couchioplanes caeruleus]